MTFFTYYDPNSSEPPKSSTELLDINETSIPFMMGKATFPLEVPLEDYLWSVLFFLDPIYGYTDYFANDVDYLFAIW